VGDAVELRVRHAGQVRTVSLRTERPPATPPADERTLAGRNPRSGATVVNISPASAQQYGADPFSAQGVLVTQTGGGFAQTIGVRPGDFIREVNGQKIATTADLAAALQAPAHGWTIVIQRAGQIITARFGV
jgi:S1-C subfamily serine protease